MIEIAGGIILAMIGLYVLRAIGSWVWWIFDAIFNAIFEGSFSLGGTRVNSYTQDTRAYLPSANSYITPGILHPRERHIDEMVEEIKRKGPLKSRWPKES